MRMDEDEKGTDGWMLDGWIARRCIHGCID